MDYLKNTTTQPSINPTTSKTSKQSEKLLTEIVIFLIVAAIGVFGWYYINNTTPKTAEAKAPCNLCEQVETAKKESVDLKLQLTEITTKSTNADKKVEALNTACSVDVECAKTIKK